MVTITGDLEESRIENGQEVFVWRIPAVSSSAAEVRARGNARVKGLENFSVKNVEQVGSGSFPGQNVYEVTVTSPR